MEIYQIEQQREIRQRTKKHRTSGNCGVEHSQNI